uniref:Anti-proliferative protein domain-containing protein n=3 Tax=Strigidae TaxID=30459 RepID=A0A8D0FM69_STROC
MIPRVFSNLNDSMTCRCCRAVNRSSGGGAGTGAARCRRGGSSLFPPAEHYKHHWFPLVPSKGSGYRCIRINHKMDPLIGKAAGMIGLSHERLFQLLPSELTLWVDPFEVSYRIGEDGSICVLYESPQPGGKAAKPLESRTSCKEEWRTGRSSPSKNYNMMTVSS